MRIKVTITDETKVALELVANYLGIPLSQLIVGADVDKYLHKRGDLPRDLSGLSDKITSLENTLEDVIERIEGIKEAFYTTPRMTPHTALNPVSESPGNGHQSAKPKSTRPNRQQIREKGQMPNADPVIPVEAPHVHTTIEQAIADNLPVHIDHLVDRLKTGDPQKDRGIKARLSQLGGKDGSLFSGSLSAAQRVEDIIKGLDPDQLSWMPLADDRRFWINLSAVEFCRRILAKD